MTTSNEKTSYPCAQLPSRSVRDMRAAHKDWVIAAAERAEQRSGLTSPNRLRGEIPSSLRLRHSTDRSTTPATQLQALIAAILNPQVTRRELRQLAQILKTGRAD